MFGTIRVRILAPAAGILLATLIPTLAMAGTTYRITNIGDLPGGADSSDAEDLNNDGQVVGSSQGADVNRHGFLWDSTSGMQDLGAIFAAGINDSSEVVGSAVFDAMHAALWDAVNGIQDIGDLPGGDDFGNGRDINNARRAVGFSNRSGFYDHAFLWDATNGMQDLGTLIGNNGFSAAYAINNLGQVVGESEAVSGGSHAFLWAQGEGMQDLGKLPGGANDTSAAYDINDAGQVVGFSAVTNFGEHAFIWDSDNGMRDLGVLPGGENWSFALGINNSGQIVGSSGAPAGSRAVLWDDGPIADLNDVIDPSDPLAPYVTLTTAKAINDAGQIAATGIDSRTGATHAYLLTPAVLLDLAALPDVNGNGAPDAAVLVSSLGGQASASKIYVRDGATGEPISQMTILDASWRAIDIANTPGATNVLIGVLAQKDDNLIAVAVHRAADGGLVREIPFLGRKWRASQLAYVPNADGPGGSAFAVVARNVDDDRVAVQLRRRSDGTLINNSTYFQNAWEPIDLQTLDDVTNNNRPELMVLGQSDAGQIVLLVKDASTRELVNKINYFGSTTEARALAVIADIGAGPAPELTVFGDRLDGRHVAQNRDALTDERVSNVFFLSASWKMIDTAGLGDVNGNSLADLAVLARYQPTGAIRAEVRDAVTGELIRSTTFLGLSWDARAIAAFDDIDGNGVQELGVAAIRADGDIRIQMKDALTGSIVSTIDIP